MNRVETSLIDLIDCFFLLFVCSEEVQRARGDKTAVEDLVSISFFYLLLPRLMLRCYICTCTDEIKSQTNRYRQ